MGNIAGHSGALLLPASFGTVYLGQHFSALLSLSNEAENSALNPVLKVEMHTSGQFSCSTHLLAHG